jgi:endonuclease/exonuclease/phosphatase family metal-dependent hydrolase
MGDFNLMYKASDNSNHRINNRLINSFREVLEELEVKPLHLHVKRFTWSSGTANPTLTKIDHFFISKYWELPNPHCYLQAIGTSMSDHCPMLITCSPFPRCYRGSL